MIKVVIIDWARTLFEAETYALYPEAKDLVQYLSQKYKLALVSLCKREPVPERRALIDSLELTQYFEQILIDPEDKNKLYEQAFEHFKVKPEEIAILDDRTVRGVQWGNKKGCKTIWVKQGKFKDELPNEETGQPNYKIDSLGE
ncbi:MAG: HAD hydrolase-like protein, partial [Candidatus Woesearchaeota archaeon]|nr:HAD hydrolase-like protein [Candidatus Woesearchaeota archaeon]